MLQTDLEIFIHQNSIKAELVEKAFTRHTLDAAEVLGVHPEQMIKSLVCLAIYAGKKKEPIIILVNGRSKVNIGKVAQILGATRIVIANEETAENYSGYPPGGTPPIGLKAIQKVIMDTKLAKEEILYGGGGRQDLALKITPDEIARVTSCIVADISQ